MRIITLVLSFLSILITALPLIRSSHWWIRIFDYPRLQIAVLCLISLLLIFIFLKPDSNKTALLILVFLALGYQLFRIYPYTSFSPLQAANYDGKKNQGSFTIFEANIKMDNKKVKEFLALIAEVKPDIVVITEPNKWWQEQIQSLKKQYPYAIEEPRENTYGMLMYSKFPLKETEINYLVDKDIPSFFTKVVLPDNQEFDMYTLHPKPPKPGTPTYKKDTEILLVGDKIKSSDRPTIVVGDLNDVGWSYTSQLFQRYSRMLDPRVGRGLFNTYSVFVPLFRYPLDHVFYSKHFGFVKLDKLKAIGSDHYPVLLEVNLKTHEEFEIDLPKASKDDKKEVNKKLNQNL